MKKYIVFLALLFSLSSCQWISDILDSADTVLDYPLGWFGDSENTAEIEDDVALAPMLGSGDLPASVDLTAYFPPIGDQGSYGTCVAWACGYNLKSFLEAKKNDYSYYSDYSKIFSPKYLFWAIDQDKKGENCNGTYFEAAFDAMLYKGIATMSTVPYSEMGDCSSSTLPEWDSEASKHMIQNYREVDVDINTLKYYLANGRAVAFGAKLGDEFMVWSGDGVLSYQTYGNVGMHAYHAMVLAGYDDNKGPNGAFLVVNSWGPGWGNNGTIWVDYKFFVDEFCFAAFVASEPEEDPDEDNDGNTDVVEDGYDLIAWELNDVDYDNPDDPDSDDPRWRTAIYNVYNAGNVDLKASDDWCIVYLLYNAYDGDDYQVILFDYYSDDYGDPGTNGPLDGFPGITAQGYWYNHVDVKAGQSVSYAVYGTNDNPFEWTYKMPDVTGDFYLVILADGFDTFEEVDESNNITYFTNPDGSPLHIENGIIQNPPAKSFVLKRQAPEMGEDADFESVVTSTNKNAYTPQEIRQMLLNEWKSGRLGRKIYDYLETGAKTKSKKLYKL